MQLLALPDYWQEQQAKIEAELAKGLPKEWDVPQPLKDAMQYSLMAGGKRMRPILTLAAAEAVGGNPDCAMPAAIAVEMIHTYSLIHDDLPAMDNDDYRRGKLTNHKVYGEAMAILAGDALLTHAFFEAVQLFRHCGVPAEAALSIIEEMAMLAGARGMVGGQAADILGEQGITGIEQLEFIHLHKTSDLIIFSLKAGGRAAQATNEQLQALEKFGRCIGLAFQIQDDLLDLIGEEEKIGKKTNSDVKQNKVTYPFLLGLEACEKLIQQLTQDGQAALKQAKLPRPERLLEIAQYLMRRDH